MHDAGVVEKDVELAEVLLGRVDHVLAIAGLRHIGSAVGGAAARLLHHRHGLVAARVVHIDDQHGCAFAREEQGGLPPDAAAGAGDERDFVFQPHMRSKYRLRSQSVTALSKAATSVRKKCA